jgi:hypothetical protein
MSLSKKMIVSKVGGQVIKVISRNLSICSLRCESDPEVEMSSKLLVDGFANSKNWHHRYMDAG